MGFSALTFSMLRIPWKNTLSFPLLLKWRLFLMYYLILIHVDQPIRCFFVLECSGNMYNNWVKFSSDLAIDITAMKLYQYFGYLR